MSPMSLVVCISCLQNAFAACLSPSRHYFNNKTLPQENAFNALQNIHVNEFPSFKLFMLECSFDVIYSMCYHACHNHECQNNLNHCFAVIVLSFKLLEASCIHLTSSVPLFFFFTAQMLSITVVPVGRSFLSTTSNTSFANIQ